MSPDRQGRLIFALPNKGRMRDPALRLLESAGIRGLGEERAYLSKTTDPEIDLLSVRAADIPVYVYYGIADLGITGRDIVAETGLEVYELADLGFGCCDLVVAVSRESGIRSPSEIPHGSKVATEFPNVTKAYFDELGVQVETITLKGAVEITPRLGLATAIVDISSTGATLEKNRLAPIGRVMSSSARLICNKISYKTKYDKVEAITNKLKGLSP
ncbi:MAG: ATP phosphoribosyltransferase [Candidatus Methanosuratincola sp.]|jgi:ATP phosphoribosyltransferase|nr:ATP phosphoribosyltransferase [Candidatus Methanosuratincola sp.]